jgi:transposase InsO family protein/transposase
MSKKLFTELEIQQLKKNVYVKNVSPKSITYTDEFKSYVIAELSKGISTKEIFITAGFNIESLGDRRVFNAVNRWKKAYKENGVMGLRDTRKGNSGRPLKHELTNEDIIRRQQAEIEYLRAELDLVKKLELEERRVITDKLPPAYAYQIIKTTIEKLKIAGLVRKLCELAGVSRSGYYNYWSNETARTSRENTELKDFELIQRAYDFDGYSKGSRGICMTLQEVFGVIFNRKKVQRLMRKFGLVCHVRKANPYRRMMKATKEHRVVPNKLKRQFKTGNPYEILLTDITYIPLQGKYVYLSAVKDSITNEILTYYLADSLRIDIVLKTLSKLKESCQNKLSPNAYIHSDQGVHYTSPKFQVELKDMGLGQSMSRRGNCWDNAPMESFFGHMKDHLDFGLYHNIEEVESAVDRFIDHYNNRRCQWNLKKLTPIKYRDQLLVA